ncbi:MAG: universal stress protein [Magnetococcales bacterium]|nr:universal stress protein [Magnetococcales bacterium]
MAAYRRVLCAVQPDGRGEGVVRRALRMARLEGCEVGVVVVMDFHTGFESDHIPFRTPAEIKAEMVRYLEGRLQGMLEKLGCREWVRGWVVAGDPEREVGRQAGEWGADLVVVGSRESYALQRSWRGDVLVVQPESDPWRGLKMALSFQSVK